tara:strand:+ start:401 stop:1018 length:618 start_codon:yes stop_codon:yes gene_type:complete
MSIVKLNNNGVKNATAFGSITGLGSMVFIKKLTASSSAALSFVNGTSDVVLDNTYKEYLFTFNNIHPQTDNTSPTVGFRDGGTDYDAVKTTTAWRAQHNEAGSDQALQYNGGDDLAQSTGFQKLSTVCGNDNDQCYSGTMHLFNPSSTTFVKHFIITGNVTDTSNYSINDYQAGYINTTTAIDGVQFKMSSGNIDAGDICLYGIN